MPSASETITVVAALTKTETNWEGDPVDEAPSVEERSREVHGCLLIPKMHPDDPTIVLDAYQVMIMDPSEIPPVPEDSIQLSDRGDTRLWDINGNVGDIRKPSGDVRVYTFVIENPR